MKGYINEETTEAIKAAADLRHTIEHYTPLEERGRNITGTCPMCHHEHALHYVKSKKLYKCFKCDFGGNSAVKYVMESQHMDYNEALHELAEIFHIVIDNHPTPTPPPTRPLATSYKNRQLTASGLTRADVRARETGEDSGVPTTYESEVFVAGTLDNFDRIAQGDDMVIRYLDLDGQQVQYYREKDPKPRPYYRVRWQFPESHALKDGTICKYKTPYGAGLHLYIPERLRDIYRRAVPTESLYFTEGEKKAEKASKHGMPAFGMAGINCLVGKDRQFPESIVKVIERCGVRNVFFLMDADWAELSQELTPDKDVAQRSRNFFYAVRRFRDWFRTLANRKIYIDVYLVLQHGDAKGIDDLLTTTLQGHESDFVECLQNATNAVAADNHYDYFDLYKISTISDSQLADIWHLNNIESFIEHHRQALTEMPEFLYGKNRWRIDEEGRLVLAQPLRDDEIFWKSQDYQTKGGTLTKYTFAYNNACRFFNNRGFYRYHQPNNNYKFIRVEGNRITEINPHQARDYAIDLVRSVCAKNDDIIDMMLRGSKMYFGADALSHIDYYEPQFMKPQKDSQILLFRDKALRISAQGIEEIEMHQLADNYWADAVKDFDFHRTETLIHIEKVGDFYNVVDSNEGQKCEFANFLYRTGIFAWDKLCDEERHFIRQPDDQQLAEMNIHFISKMTAIGYLLHRFREKSTAKAVIGMDGKITEVGTSSGRSGKSLMGLALEQMLTQVTINGKNCDPVGDKFLFEEVNERTQNIFIDDVCVNFNFEDFFPIITGKLSVNAKGVGRFTLSDHQVPKLYITTNHAINGDSGSYEARQFKLAFSDYYNVDFQPRQQFGHDFFDDWDHEQWNLFYNFMCECLQLYFKARQEGWGVNGSGLIEAPCENLERRQLRQEMGEVFLNWLNDYLQVDEDSIATPQCGRVNNRLVRGEMMEDYLNKCPTQKRYFTPQSWWKRLTLYCRYYKLRLNPVESRLSDKPQHCKINGTEYITIANNFFETSHS